MIERYRTEHSFYKWIIAALVGCFMIQLLSGCEKNYACINGVLYFNSKVIPVYKQGRPVKCTIAKSRRLK